jgi:hypothetical protein
MKKVKKTWKCACGRTYKTWNNFAIHREDCISWQVAKTVGMVVGLCIAGQILKDNKIWTKHNPSKKVET